MATYYWVPGGTGNWTSSSNWASSSGGTGGAGVPSISDDAVFDVNSGATGSVATLDTNASVLSITGTSGFKGSVNLGTNTLTIAGTGNACVFSGAARLTGSIGAKVRFTYAGSSAMTVNTGYFPINVSVLFTAGSYALSFSGAAYDLDFWQSGVGTYSGTVTIASNASCDGTLSLNPGMTTAVGTNWLSFYTAGAIRTNGVTVNFDVLVAISLTLLDALYMPNNQFIAQTDASVNGAGKNITAKYITLNGSIAFGSSNPTWTTTSFWTQSNIVAFSGTGTATIAIAASGSVYHYGKRIPATINLLGDATITTGASPAASLPAGEFLGLKNSGYGTLTVLKDTNFVEFALKGTVSNTQYLNGSGKTIGKVDPWYVGANSTDGGGNTNIVFTAGEGVDYLNVSNVVGSYNYGPHFMAFM